MPIDATADALEKIVALMTRSVELRLAQDDDAALACLDQAVAIAPRLPLAQINRAQLLAELRRYAEALDGYDAFLCCAPSPEIAEARQDLLEAAFADLEQRLTERPDDLAARLECANLLRQTQLDAARHQRDDFLQRVGRQHQLPIPGTLRAPW